MKRCVYAIVALVCGVALAADYSSDVLNVSGKFPGTATLVEPVVSSAVMFNSSSADGSAITDPYAWGSFATAAIEARSGGRLFMNTCAKGRFEVTPYFTTAGATATIQLFAFDLVPVGRTTASDRASLAFPIDGNSALGAAYPLARDSGVQTFTLSATAEINKLSISAAQAWPSQANGTTYYVGQRMIFDTAGFYAFMPYVTSISGGTLVLVGRAI